MLQIDLGILQDTRHMAKKDILKGQVRHTRKFLRKDPTGGLGSRIWLGGIFVWSAKLVRTGNREILMWALNMPGETVEAQCRVKISPGKQLVTKCELTEPRHWFDGLRSLCLCATPGPEF